MWQIELHSTASSHIFQAQTCDDWHYFDPTDDKEIVIEFVMNVDSYVVNSQK